MKLPSTDVELLPEISGYSRKSRLGGGRWSQVYLATQESLQRSVAIKVLTDSEKDILARFEREAEVMASVSHRDVVNIIDRGTVDGHYFIVMEFLDGGSLRERIVPGKPLKMRTVRSVLSSLATALTGLHAKGLIHRDVKPDNVLFDSNGQIKLCDFGFQCCSANWVN